MSETAAELTARSAAAVLGIHRRTLRAMIDRGEFAPDTYRITDSGRIYVKRAEVHRRVEQQRRFRVERAQSAQSAHSILQGSKDLLRELT